MCNDKSKLVSINEDECDGIYIATEQHVKSQGIGSVKMNVRINDHSISDVKLQIAFRLGKYVPRVIAFKNYKRRAEKEIGYTASNVYGRIMRKNTSGTISPNF